MLTPYQLAAAPKLRHKMAAELTGKADTKLRYSHAACNTGANLCCPFHFIFFPSLPLFLSSFSHLSLSSPFSSSIINHYHHHQQQRRRQQQQQQQQQLSSWTPISPFRLQNLVRRIFISLPRLLFLVNGIAKPLSSHGLPPSLQICRHLLQFILYFSLYLG
jgi:hypothetical protein